MYLSYKHLTSNIFCFTECCNGLSFAAVTCVLVFWLRTCCSNQTNVTEGFSISMAVSYHPFWFQGRVGAVFLSNSSPVSKHDFKKFVVSGLSVLSNLDDTGTGVQFLLKKFKRLWSTCQEVERREGYIQTGATSQSIVGQPELVWGCLTSGLDSMERCWDPVEKG